MSHTQSDAGACEINGRPLKEVLRKELKQCECRRIEEQLRHGIHQISVLVKSVGISAQSPGLPLLRLICRKPGKTPFCAIVYKGSWNIAAKLKDVCTLLRTMVDDLRAEYPPREIPVDLLQTARGRHVGPCRFAYMTAEFSITDPLVRHITAMPDWHKMAVRFSDKLLGTDDIILPDNGELLVAPHFHSAYEAAQLSYVAAYSARGCREPSILDIRDHIAPYDNSEYTDDKLIAAARLARFSEENGSPFIEKAGFVMRLYVPMTIPDRNFINEMMLDNTLLKLK